MIAKILLLIVVVSRRRSRQTIYSMVFFLFIGSLKNNRVHFRYFTPAWHASNRQRNDKFPKNITEA